MTPGHCDICNRQLVPWADFPDGDWQEEMAMDCGGTCHGCVSVAEHKAIYRHCAFHGRECVVWNHHADSIGLCSADECIERQDITTLMINASYDRWKAGEENSFFDWLTAIPDAIETGVIKTVEWNSPTPPEGGTDVTDMSANDFSTFLQSRSCFDTAIADASTVFVGSEGFDFELFDSLAQDGDDMDTTELLLSSPTNAARLESAIAQYHAGEFREHDLLEDDGDDLDATEYLYATEANARALDAAFASFAHHGPFDGPEDIDVERALRTFRPCTEEDLAAAESWDFSCLSDDKLDALWKEAREFQESVEDLIRSKPGFRSIAERRAAKLAGDDHD